MAYFTMPKIGEPITCNGDCGHRDCQLTREQANTPCDACGKIIEAGTAFVFIKTAPLMIRHYHCHVY
jgi:hypothetical protein